MKKTIIVLFAGVALFAGLSSSADAKVRIYFGVPYYDYQIGPDYIYNDNYGWYRPSNNMGNGYHRDRSRLSCNEAGRLVRRNGFRNVRARECDGRTYTFIATRNNHRVLIYVNSRTGAVWRS
jgi:hypothetical protein